MRVVLRGIRKRFASAASGAPALDGVDFAADAGQVVALLGENGAGKSTLVNVLAGRIAADSGTIEIDGARVSIGSPREAAARGIGMVPQHDDVIGDLTVAENLELARLDRRRGLLSRRVLAERQADAERRTGFTLAEPHRRADTLGLGERQRIEIVRALSTGARVLVLDEPTAVLTPDEADRLIDEIRRLARCGMGVVFITHRLAEVDAVADRVTVLRRGRVAARFDARPFDSAALVHAMVGESGAAPRERGSRAASSPARDAAARIAVDGLAAGRLRAATFAVGSGEIVAVVGVDGNGQRELFECISGLRAPDAGTIAIDRRPLDRSEPALARALGLAIVPEDRRGAGLAPSLSIAENLHLATPALATVGRGPFLPRGALAASAATARDRFGVRGAELGAPASALSGGNQQRVVLARELAVRREPPRAVLLQNPTRGLDLVATAFVRDEVARLRDEHGAGILWITSDLDEAEDVADRIVVLAAGRVVATLPRGVDRATIGRALAGGAP